MRTTLPVYAAIGSLLLVSGSLAQSWCPAPCKCLDHGEVYCNGTQISRVPGNLPTNLTLLDLSDNPIRSVPRDAFAGLNSMTSLTINGNQLQEGDIEDGALSLPALVDVDLSYNSYTSIPRVLPKGLITFRLMQCAMQTLAQDSFVNYTNILYLDLSNNKLETVEPHTFDPLSRLQTLYISFNKLRNEGLPSTVFMKNTNLTILSARFNQLQTLLPNLPISLQHLDYVGNQIKTLPSFAFRGLVNLQTIEMWQGAVTTIEDNAFAGLTKVAILDFMQDKIKSRLTKDTFNGLTGLATLYFSLNNVSVIDPAAFRSFGSLTQLWLDDNRLARLDPQVLDQKYMPHLSMLFIDFNPWYCDCHLRWLREKMDNATYVIQDPHLITCAGPARVQGRAWDVLKPSDFVCP